MESERRSLRVLIFIDLHACTSGVGSTMLEGGREASNARRFSSIKEPDKFVFEA
jgi:hypothetical protein